MDQLAQEHQFHTDMEHRRVPGCSFAFCCALISCPTQEPQGRQGSAAQPPNASCSKDVGRMEGGTKMPRSHPGTRQNETVFILSRGRRWRRDRECGGLAPGAGSAGRRRRRMSGSGTKLLGTIQSYWELLSQKSLSVLMTSDRRKRRAGVYRRRGRDSEPLSWDEPKEPGSSQGSVSQHTAAGAPELGPRVAQSSQASTTNIKYMGQYRNHLRP